MQERIPEAILGPQSSAAPHPRLRPLLGRGYAGFAGRKGLMWCFRQRRAWGWS